MSTTRIRPGSVLLVVFSLASVAILATRSPVATALSIAAMPLAWLSDRAGRRSARAYSARRRVLFVGSLAASLWVAAIVAQSALSWRNYDAYGDPLPYQEFVLDGRPFTTTACFGILVVVALSAASYGAVTLEGKHRRSRRPHRNAVGRPEPKTAAAAEGGVATTNAAGAEGATAHANSHH